MGHQYLGFAAVAAAFMLLPGADFTIVVRSALNGRTSGVSAAIGVGLGLLLHTAIAAAGLAAVLVASPGALETVRYAGVAFLLYLGGRNLVTAWRRRQSTETSSTAENGSRFSSWWGALAQGFFTNALNPKAPLLFLSIMPQFVPPGDHPGLALLGLSVIAVAIGLVWFLIVALVSERLAPLLRTPSRRNAVDGISGAIMVAFAAAVAFQ